MRTVLLTGGTGVFGSYLVRDLAAHDDVRLVLIVRASSDEEARARIASQGSIPEHTHVFAGDLLKPRMGLLKTDYDKLLHETSSILHAAASIRFNSPLEEARRNNVATMEHIVAFAQACKNLQRFGYLSTALVAGRRTGIISEDDFEHQAGFNNTYQQTKYEAEALMRASRLPLVVFRPPLVYTPDKTSETSLTSFLVILISLVVSGRLPYVLGMPHSQMDMVNGAEAAKAICDIFLKEHLSHHTYHITNGDSGLNIGVFHKIMEAEKGASIPIEYCGNGDEGTLNLRKKLSSHPELQPIYNKAESFLGEPAFPKIFDNAHTLSELGIALLGQDPKDILRKIVHDTLWNTSK